MKKCSRCSLYFGGSTKEASKEAVCKFHTAPWVDVHVPGKGADRIGIWSCCKAVSKSAPGCFSGTHIEDKGTTDILRKFEIFAVKGTRAEALELLDTEFIQRNLGTAKVQVMGEQDKSVEKPKPAARIPTPGDSTKPVAKDAPTGYIKHPIKFTDTLQGIALRYNTSVATLKQLNKLFANSDLFKLKTLLVPDPDADPVDFLLSEEAEVLHDGPKNSTIREWYISKFAVGAGVCPAEALFYLSDNKWIPHLAQASLAEDVAWAEEQLKNQKGRLREFLGDTDVQTVAVVAAGCIIVLLCILI